VPHGAASVEAKSLSVGALLEERYPFAVPRYQRSYAWEDEAVADFVSDIRALLVSPPGTVSHFFGGLVCIERTDNQQVRPLSYEVVDGQQRLATFGLALAAVVKVAAELVERAQRNGNQAQVNSAETLRTDTADKYVWWKEADIPAGVTHLRPRLRLSLADDAVFQHLLSGGDCTPTRESHELLIAAHEALLTLAREVAGTTGSITTRIDRLLRLRQALIDDSHVIHIVSKDRRQAYRLFSVLNDRGESLSDADLLRSRSLELLEGFSSEQEDVARLWDEMLAAPAKQVDAFFKALYPSFMGKRATGDLFEAIAGVFFPPAPPATATDAIRVVATVESFRDELQVFLKLAAGEWPFERPPGAPTAVRAWQVERLGRVVLTLKHELALPVLLAGARSVSEKMFAELVYLIEVFAFRYKNICNAHAGPPAALYYTQAKAMRDATSTAPYRLNPFRVALRQLIIDHAGDQRFSEFLSEKLRYSNSSQRGNIREFLTTLEDHDQWLQTTPANSTARPKPSMSKVIDIGNATLEHVYPQNARPADRVASVEPVKHHLGNLTFFAETDNIAAANKTFAQKRTAHYAASAVAMTRALATHAQWTDAEIAQREVQLVADALRVFVV
jgi:hypothetical protein